MKAGKQARPRHRDNPMRSDITFVRRRSPEGPGPPTQARVSPVKVNRRANEFARVDIRTWVHDVTDMYAPATHKRFRDHAGQLAARA
jgi:hypothetical protein